MNNHVIWLDQLSICDVNKVGGKNASLGEMLGKLSAEGIKIPNGFATNMDSFHEFLTHNHLQDKIKELISSIIPEDHSSLEKVALNIQELILAATLPASLIKDIDTALSTLQGNDDYLSVAVRSSATSEDTLIASYAGQQKTILNVSGINSVLNAVKMVFASLYSQRAINQRLQTEHPIKESMSVCIQKMVRSDTGSAGVMFTLDTESGFDQVVFVTSAFGLGETVVQGTVNPDEFYVHKASLLAGRPSILRRNLGAKTIQMIHSNDTSGESTVETIRVERSKRLTFSLDDKDIIELARQALLIEQHYQQAMDIEWAKDGESGEIYIVQARPETVKSRTGSRSMERYLLKETGSLLCEGRSVGHKIGSGPVKVLDHKSQVNDIKEGDVLVAEMTDPDWEPAMKKASAIITNRGGRTCHAAIIARELGIPAVVGCGDATDELRNGQPVTVSCAEGDTGFIYDGSLDFEHKTNTTSNMPELPFELMMNVGNPDRAFDFQSLPNQGVGLARLEFIINRMIGVHPKALLNFESLPPEVRMTVERRIAGYASPIDFYVEKLVEGISTLAAAFSPKKVIVRLSDFKSNEYANLIGGSLYEPEEENPMLGFRGAARYISKTFRDCFELECRAIKKVRNEMAFTNIELMVPFVRTVGEAKQVVDLLAENGLVRGENGLRIIMMCELPANALLAEQFLQYFDGFSIGSNDLTQLTLGLDRDSGVIAHLFNESDDAIRQLMHMAITACKKHNKYIGICGQGPSDHPDFAKWLMEMGVDSVSLSPDSMFDTWYYLAEATK